MTINVEAFTEQPFYDELITPKGNARAYARKMYSFINKRIPKHWPSGRKALTSRSSKWASLFVFTQRRKAQSTEPGHSISSPA